MCCSTTGRDNVSNLPACTAPAHPKYIRGWVGAVLILKVKLWLKHFVHTLTEFLRGKSAKFSTPIALYGDVTGNGETQLRIKRALRMSVTVLYHPNLIGLYLGPPYYRIISYHKHLLWRQSTGAHQRLTYLIYTVNHKR